MDVQKPTKIHATRKISKVQYTIMMFEEGRNKSLFNLLHIRIENLIIKKKNKSNNNTCEINLIKKIIITIMKT